MLFLFVVIMVYLFISGFLKTFATFELYFFITFSSSSSEAQIKYSFAVNALEAAEVELFEFTTVIETASELRTEQKRKPFSLCHTTKVKKVGFPCCFSITSA